MKKSLFSFLGATALLVTFSACNGGPTEAEVAKAHADSLAKAQSMQDSINAAAANAKATAMQDSINAAATAAAAVPVAPVATDKKAAGKVDPKAGKKPVMKPATKPVKTTTKVEPKPTPAPAPVKQDPTKAQVGGKGGAGATEVKAQVGGKGGAEAKGQAVEETKAKIGGK